MDWLLHLYRVSFLVSFKNIMCKISDRTLVEILIRLDFFLAAVKTNLKTYFPKKGG